MILSSNKELKKSSFNDQYMYDQKDIQPLHLLLSNLSENNKSSKSIQWNHLVYHGFQNSIQNLNAFAKVFTKKW